MTDENHELQKKFGRKINKEKEGFTEVDYDGIARPVLKIPSMIPKGRRRLTAVYTDERQKINKSSLNRTIVIYGSKAYVHCPTIYQPTNLKEITLTANIFSNNRPVPAGNSIFKITNQTVSKEKLQVIQGYVEETIKKQLKENTYYQCAYEGSEKWKITQARGNGDIILYEETRTPLIVYVCKLILNEGEKAKLVARVALRNHGNAINFPQDIPKSGKFAFYIDGEQYGDIVDMGRNGFATIPYTATHGIGVHTIIAEYIPDTDEMKNIYQNTWGSNTLFIGNDTNRPQLTQVGLNCGAKNNTYTFEFNSNKTMNGKIRLFIDGTSVKATQTEENGTIDFMGNIQTLHEQTLTDATNFKFTLKIPDYNNASPNTIWGYGGNHNMILQYIEPDENLGDMEYWYFWNDFYIQHPVRIYVDDEWLDNTSDGGVFTGNNMYMDEDGNLVHYKPSLDDIPRSITIGNPLKVHVENIDYGDNVTKGSVKVTVTTRKKDKWVN